MRQSRGVLAMLRACVGRRACVLSGFSYLSQDVSLRALGLLYASCKQRSKRNSCRLRKSMGANSYGFNETSLSCPLGLQVASLQCFCNSL